MELSKASIKYNASRGVFCQIAHIEKDGELLGKVVLCASEEFLAMTLKKSLEKVINGDPDIEKWFDNEMHRISMVERISRDPEPDAIEYYLYPKTPQMLDAADSFLHRGI